MTIHNIRCIGAERDDTYYEVDLEWVGGRAWYRFTFTQSEPSPVVFSSRECGLPLAFFAKDSGASVPILKLVSRFDAGDVLAFPIEA